MPRQKIPYDYNPLLGGGMEGGIETGIQRKCSINRLIHFFIHFTAGTLT